MSLFALRGHLDLLDGQVGLIHDHRTYHKGLILHQVNLHGIMLLAGVSTTFEESFEKTYCEAVPLRTLDERPERLEDCLEGF